MARSDPPCMCISLALESVALDWQVLGAAPEHSERPDGVFAWPESVMFVAGIRGST